MTHKKQNFNERFFFSEMARIFNIDIGQDASKYGVNTSLPKKKIA